MSLNDSFAIFDSITNALLPGGEGGVVAFSHVYFDESGTHKGSQILAMAGYWFDADQARKFSRDWAKELERFGLPAAHQTDCALGFGDYKKMIKSRRVEIQKCLIEHIKRRSKFGFAICVGRSIYDEIMQGIAGAPSAYTFLLLLCVNQIREEIEFTKYNGRVAYFFESGHADATEANKFMNHMAQCNPEPHGYAAHAFADKRIALPLQAADMLVWQVRHLFERALIGHTKMRKDFAALLRSKDMHTIVEPKHLLALSEIYRNAPAILGNDVSNLEAGKPGNAMAEEIMRAYGLNPNLSRQVRQLFARRGG